MDGKARRPGPRESGEARRRRLRRNEQVLRRVNGRIEELNRVALMVDDPADPRGQAAFLCECAMSECSERIAVDVATYAALPAEPDRYVVIPGHESPEIEQVVARRSDYLVVTEAAWPSTR